MAIKPSLKPHLAIPKAHAEMGPHYIVKQIALNSVTEHVGYGCLPNLLSSPLCMGPQLYKGSLLLRWCKNYKIKPEKTKRPPLFCICNMKTIPDEEDFSIHIFLTTSWKKTWGKAGKIPYGKRFTKLRNPFNNTSKTQLIMHQRLLGLHIKFESQN